MFARKKLKGIGRGHTLAGVTHMNWNMFARKKLKGIGRGHTYELINQKKLLTLSKY